jgi:hypothetical protein
VADSSQTDAHGSMLCFPIQFVLNASVWENGAIVLNRVPPYSSRKAYTRTQRDVKRSFIGIFVDAGQID